MKTVETKAFIMIIHDDLLIEFKVKKNVTLQASDVWESKRLSVDYIPGKKFFVLVEAEENTDLSGDARRATASAEYAEHVAALAICTGKTHEHIIGSLFLKVNKPVVPAKFFNNRTEAIDWLMSQSL